MAAADIRRGRGRPGHLTPELADQLVAQLDAGAGPAEAARAVGLGERTLRTWRRRAWSSRPVDAAYVDLEKRIQRAIGSAAASTLSATDWQAAAAFLEGEYGERWGPVEPDDLLGELG